MNAFLGMPHLKMQRMAYHSKRLWQTITMWNFLDMHYGNNNFIFPKRWRYIVYINYSSKLQVIH